VSNIPSNVTRAVPTTGSTLLCLLILMLSFILAEVLVASVCSNETTATTQLLFSILIAWPMALYAAKKIKGIEFRESFSLRKVPNIMYPLSLLAGLSLSLVFLSLITYIPTPPPESVNQFHETTSSSNHLSLLMAMLVVGPIGEELFFRGWLLPIWARRYGSTRAILATSVVFSLFHMLSWRILIAFPIGLLLGWITLKTQSVLPAITSHIASNASSSLLDPILKLAGLSSIEIQEMASIPYWLPILAALFLTLSVVFLFRTMTANEGNQNRLPA